MAVYERSTLLRSKDDNGDEYLLYPITKLDCVDGAEDLVRVDKEQELTAAQKAQVLKNIGGLCAPVSAQVDKFLKVSAVDENGNVTAVEAVSVTQASENLDEVLTQQAELISELETALVNKASGGGVSGDVYWEDIHNKPFGETTELVDVLPTTTFENFSIDSTFGLYNKYRSATYDLVVGETYKVFWDGVEYECVGQKVENPALGTNIVGLGNGTAWGLLGNDEPFIILRNDSFESYISLTDTEEGGSHEVRIARENVIIKTLDNKFLRFFDRSIVKEIMPTKTVEFGDTDGYLNDPANVIFIAVNESTDDRYEVLKHIEVGKEYLVVFDGVEYSCMARGYSRTISGSDGNGSIDHVILGNAALDSDVHMNADTAEPFCISCSKVELDEGYTLKAGNIYACHPAAATFETEMSIAEIKYTIKPEYIEGSSGGVSSWNDLKDKPFGETTELVELLPTTTFENFFVNPQFGIYFQQRPATYTFTVGETYKITWDGTDYECVAQDASAAMPGTIAIGNGSAYGLSGNDEPFVVAITSDNYEVYFALTDTEEGSSHEVRITKEQQTVKHLDNKYLEFMSVGGGSGKEIMPEQTVTLTLNSENIENPDKSEFMWNDVDAAAAILSQLEYGKRYSVTFDGNEYLCTPQDLSSIFAEQTPEDAVCDVMLALGNIGLTGMGNDTGEPFCMTYVRYLNTDGSVFYEQGVLGALHTSADASFDVKIGIREVSDTGKAVIKNEYLDFIEFVGAAGKELIPVQTFDFVPENPPEEGTPVQDITFMAGAEVAMTDPITTLEPNKHYIVTFDGAEYACTALDLLPFIAEDPSELPAGFKMVGLGNIGGFDLPGAAYSGEPFAVVLQCIPAGETEPEYVGYMVATKHTSADASVTHEVGIKEAGESKAVIKSEYLPDNLGGVTSWNDLEDKPFGETTDFVELLPSTEYTEFFSNPTFGCYQHNESATYSLIVGDTYKIIWDGVEYECVVHDVSSLMDGYVAMGNGTSWGFSGNNEPFIIAQSPSQTLMYCSLTDDSVTPHTVQVFKKTTVIKTIDPKYLPDDIGGGSGGVNPLPEINESGADNGKVLTVNGTAVEWQTPVSELPEVSDADNGKVLTVNGTEVEWKAPAPALPEVSTADDGKVMTVVNGVWAAQTTTSAPALPEVSTADAGKFLRVSATGAWVAETIPNAEEASF